MPRMTYEETMAYGARQYADVLHALSEAGLPAEFNQTGGMNAAITVTLEGGAYLLVADLEDALSWERASHRGWYVGLYVGEDSGEPMRYEEAQDSDLGTLMELVDTVLAGPAR
jgi:hypothetical protein